MAEQTLTAVVTDKRKIEMRYFRCPSRLRTMPS